MGDAHYLDKQGLLTDFSPGPRLICPEAAKTKSTALVMWRQRRNKYMEVCKRAKKINRTND